MIRVQHHTFKKGLFILLIVMMILPAIQARYKIIPEGKLTGAFETTDPPDFANYTNTSWMSGDFQTNFNNRLEHNIGFRNELVRVHNQIDFSLYNKANAEGVVVGKHNILFEEDYIKEYLGMYFVGENVWEKKAHQLKKVQDTLQAMGKQLLIVFEPSKASIYPEYFPRQYDRTPKRPSNYEAMKHYFGEAGLQVLDLDHFFLNLKSHQKAPLFTGGGTHWSYYGAALAADTTLKMMRKLGLNVPELSIGTLSTSDTIRHPDNDIWLAMNLIKPLSQKQPLYPQLNYKQAGGTKPSVLIVGDSFYFNWLNDNIPLNSFSNCEFWYYNASITRCDYSPGGNASDRDLLQEVLSHDVIMIMITGRFHHAFAWIFDEEIYDIFYPGYRDPVWTYSNSLRSYGDEFSRLYKDAGIKNISLQERIEKEASYLFYQDYQSNPDKYADSRDKILYYSLSISSTPEWMESIRKKAAINGVSVKEQLNRDATLLYEEELRKAN